MNELCSFPRVHVLRAWNMCKKFIDISLPYIPLANHLTLDRQIIIHGKLCITPYTIPCIDADVKSHFKKLLLCRTYIHQNELPCYHDIYQASNDYRTWCFKCNLTWLQLSIYGLIFFPKSIHMWFYFVLRSTAGWHILLRYTLVDWDVLILAIYSTTSNVLMIPRARMSSCMIVTQLEYTVECRYTAFHFVTILHTPWQQQNVNQTSNSRGSYGVSILRVLKKIYRVITAPHCILL